MHAATHPPVFPGNRLPLGVCYGVCQGPQWQFLYCNDSLARQMSLEPGALEAESLFSVFYKNGMPMGVDAVKASVPDVPFLFRTQDSCYVFLWSRVPQDEAAFPADGGVVPPAGEPDERKYFLFHEVPNLLGRSDSELLWQDLKVILDSIYDGIWVIDGEGMTVLVNKALDRIAGITPEDVVGKHVSVPMTDGRFTSCVTLAALEQQKAITLFDDYASGKRCLNTSIPIFDQEGKVRRVVASIRDMSDLEELQIKLAEAEREAKLYKERLGQPLPLSPTDFIGTSPKMRACIRSLEKAAKVSSNLLLLGETGTGKTRAASFIHQHSTRANGPFIKVNCAAIPHTLLESELFGYEKGAFTGAAQEGKKGFFELADKGTLFLDEVGELPQSMQAKLLHVLDTFSFHRVGGTKEIKVDVRVLSATNRPLEEVVQQGDFRADLYYRLRVLSVTIPSMREHPEDIPTLATHFLSDACERLGTNKFFDPKVLQKFSTHPWLGNVRELQATVEFLAAMAEGNIIKLRDLPPQFECLKPKEDGPVEWNLRKAVDMLEHTMIRDALAQTGSTYKAASLLGVSQSTVVRKAYKLRISVPEE